MVTYIHTTHLSAIQESHLMGMATASMCKKAIGRKQRQPKETVDDIAKQNKPWISLALVNI